MVLELAGKSMRIDRNPHPSTHKLGPGVGSYSLFLGFRLPYTSQQKGHPVFPRLLLGLETLRPELINP